MSKAMKSADKYLLTYIGRRIPNVKYSEEEKDIIEAIKQAQVDAWNEALDKAAESVKLLEQSNWGKYENHD